MTYRAITLDRNLEDNFGFGILSKYFFVRQKLFFQITSKILVMPEDSRILILREVYI